MNPGANPFDQLMGLVPVRLPNSPSMVMVVDGKRITDMRQITQPTTDGLANAAEFDEAEQLRREVIRARNRARYQRQRLDPVHMAKRQAWYEANRAEVRAYNKVYKAEHQARMRELQSAWAKRQYHQNPDLARARALAYYAANREQILATCKARRTAVKAAKAAINYPTTTLSETNPT